MKLLADFEFNQVPLCDGVILISQVIRDDFPSQQVYADLEILVRQAREEICEGQHYDLQLEKLLSLFYGPWGFKDASGVYCLSDAPWLDNVLKNRQGNAVSLGAILLWIADRLDIPLMPVLFPTQMLLRADWLDGEMWLINPFNGDTLDEHTLEVWLRGNINPVAQLFDDDLDEAENAEVIHKMLDTLKSALMEERQMELALRASEVLLQFNPEDPYEIRDRGLIYAQLECEHMAIHDLNYFIEHYQEDPISEMIRAQINTISSESVTLH